MPTTNYYEDAILINYDDDPLLFLDSVVVKDRLTSLHKEVDKILADLSTRSGPDIARIPEEMERCLAEALAYHDAALATSRQRDMFTQASGSLLSSARRQAAEVQSRRIQAYQADVVERQNAVLSDRAVADENVFDNALQAECRDLIAFNLNSLHSSLPQAERTNKVDAALRDLYASILDRRLELRPESAAAMLRSHDVRQALGSEKAREYDHAVTAAVAARKPVIIARDWITVSLPPDQAADRAKRHGEDGKAILAEYRRLRTDRNEKAALAHLLSVRDAWSALVAARYRLDAVATRPANPALASLIRDLLDGWLVGGGRPPEPDYAAFLRYMTLPRHEIWAELAGEAAVHSFVRDLAGPDSLAFAITIRRLAGSATPADWGLLTDLLFARGQFVRLHGGEDCDVQKENTENTETADAAEIGKNAENAQNKEKNPLLNRFLSAFYRDRRIKLDRLGGTELLSGELSEIVRSCLESVGMG